MSGAPAEPIDRHDRRIAGWLWAVVVFVGSLLVFDANDGNTDAEVHFQQIRAMAKHGTWAFVDDGPVANLILRAHAAGSGAAASQRGVDGRVYGHFGTAYVLWGLPFYAAGSAIAQLCPGVEAKVAGTPFLVEKVGVVQDYIPRIAVTAISPFFLGWAVAALYLAARRLGARRLAALVAALAYAFATYAGPTARHCGSDTMAAAWVAVALASALGARERGRAAFVGTGLAAGFLVATRMMGIASLPGIALAVAASSFTRTRDSRTRWGDCIAAAAPFAALAAAVLVLNTLRWGGPLEWGYRHTLEEEKVLQGNLLVEGGRNLFLSFFSGSRGLVFFALPIVVLGAAGIWILGKRERAAAWALGVGAIATAVPPSLTNIWSGTWSWGPRYHLCAVVFLAPAAAVALDAALRVGGARRAAALAAIALGALANFPALVGSPFGYLQAAAQALRIERPAATLADPKDPDAEAIAEGQRQMFLFVAPVWSPYNAIRGQWRWLAWGIAGREAIPVRDFFGVDSGAVLVPQLIEYGGLRSPWWLTFRARTGESWVFAVAAGLALLALKSGLALRSAWRDARGS